MKMKLSAIKNNVYVMSIMGSKRLPIKISYAISVNMEKLNAALAPAERERIKILERYAEKDEHGKPVIEDGNYKISGEYRRYVDQEVEKLFEEEADIDLRKIREDWLEDCENERFDPFTPGELFAIRFMIEE